MSNVVLTLKPLNTKSLKELNASGRFCNPMNIASNVALEGSVANKAPKTIDSGMKSINIANKQGPHFSSFFS